MPSIIIDKINIEKLITKYNKKIKNYNHKIKNYKILLEKINIDIEKDPTTLKGTELFIQHKLTCYDINKYEKLKENISIILLDLHSFLE